jgi:hypothetical protein
MKPTVSHDLVKDLTSKNAAVHRKIYEPIERAEYFSKNRVAVGGL